MTDRKLNVLLLEDNESDAELVRLSLGQYAPGQFALTHVDRLADALSRIGAGDFDAVMCDLDLPDSKGLATARAIAGRAPALPLIVLTGLHDDELGHEAIRHGAQDYLVKGESDGATIARSLRYAIQRKRLEIGVRTANEALEQRVAERTAELEAAIRKLRKSETRFRELTELTSDWYWEQDENFRYTWISPGPGERAGPATSDRIGKTRWELPTEGVSPAYWAEHRRVLEAHLPFRDFESPPTGSADPPRYVSVSGLPVFDEDGRFCGYRGVGRDITERKAAEQALARQKDLYIMLSQTNQAIVRLTTREELFAAVCRCAVEHGHFLFAWIGVIVPDEQQVRLVARYGEDRGYLDQMNLTAEDAGATGHGITGKAVRSGAVAVCNDFLGDPMTAPWREVGSKAGVRAMASFPLRAAGMVAGVLNVYAGDHGFFTEDLLPTLDGMAEDVSFALDNFAREADRRQAHRALQESEARYRSLFENMLNGFAYCRMQYDAQDRPVDYVYLEVNAAFERLTGLHDVVGKPVTAVIPGIREANPELFEICGRVASSGVPETFEVQVRPLSKWYHASAYCPGKGHFVALFDDITERKKVELALRESEEKLRTVFEGALDGMLVADVGTRKFLIGNPSICRMLGHTVEELTRLGVEDIHPKDALPRVITQFERLGRGELSTAVNVLMLRKDRSEFYADIGATRIRFEGRDCMLGIFRDVTERRQSEEALRAAEEQFRGLVEQPMTGIYIIQDGRYAYVNPRFAEILGYDSPQELIGRDSLAVIAEKDRGAVTASVRKRIKGGGGTVSYSATALRKDGSTIEIGVHGAPATHRGRPAVIGLMQDISEKKRAEEQIRRYLAQLESAFMRTVEVAMTLSELRDPYTSGHERRVAEVAVAIGAELGFDAGRLEGLRVAGYLHDIGKITIPSEILSKPGRLTPLEFQLIKGHAQASYDVLKNVEFPWPVAEIALQHHERMDGSGYPRGLKGEAILIEARVLAVADTIEAMSSHRPYRVGLGIEKALAEIERGRGSAYDPVVADACLALFREKGFALPG